MPVTSVGAMTGSGAMAGIHEPGEAADDEGAATGAAEDADGDVAAGIDETVCGCAQPASTAKAASAAT